MLAKRLNNRLEVLSIVILLIFVALVSRLEYLQVVQGKYYGQKADGNRIRHSNHGSRGNVFDRNGIALVSNLPGFTVSLLPVNGAISDEVIGKLADILQMNGEEIKAKLKTKIMGNLNQFASKLTLNLIL